MCISCFPRFFAWLVEIFAQFFFHLDLKVDTLGLFAANGIEIKFKNGFKIVSFHNSITLSDTDGFGQFKEEIFDVF